MKKLIALIAVVVLFTASAFAVTVTNNATVSVKCKTMEFTCNGTVEMGDLLADGETMLNGTTQWNITNWGNTGQFSMAYITPPPPEFITVTPPITGGDASDLIITEGIGTLSGGWSLSANLTGMGTYTFTGTNCNITGYVTYNFNVVAKPGASKGVYTIAFAVEFTAL